MFKNNNFIKKMIINHKLKKIAFNQNNDCAMNH